MPSNARIKLISIEVLLSTGIVKVHIGIWLAIVLPLSALALLVLPVLWQVPVLKAQVQQHGLWMTLERIGRIMWRGTLRLAGGRTTSGSTRDDRHTDEEDIERMRIGLA
jgi:hypothetical protein